MGNLVLDSLEIKRFRGFRHLQIEKLGRVNLIVGKNNIGKSSLLEALYLYANRGNPTVLWELLKDRDEEVENIPSSISENDKVAGISTYSVAYSIITRLLVMTTKATDVTKLAHGQQ